MKVDAVMITKFTTKYSNGIYDTLLNQWESDCKWEYLNNATTKLHSKDRDESNTEEKGKHGKFTTKFLNKD